MVNKIYGYSKLIYMCKDGDKFEDLLQLLKWSRTEILLLCIIWFQTTKEELKEFFSRYGAVRDSKIIRDAEGLSKG